MSTVPVAILGGGPVGLTLALLLARRHVPSVVVDARSLEEARRDTRLLALSCGTLDTLATVAELPSTLLAPIRTVVVSSRGEFGRVVLRERENGGRLLGATMRYGELVAALAAAAASAPLIQVRRPCAAESVRQQPQRAVIGLSDGTQIESPLAVNAEGAGARQVSAIVRQYALVGDVEMQGPTAGTAFERFTRDGPLALLPLPAPAAGTRRDMSLVWCMPAATADRREQLTDQELLAELQEEIGERNGRVLTIRHRGRYPLLEQARDELREHRVVHIGNAAQTLHPVAGQGLNLGVRDCVALAEFIGEASAAAEDVLRRLPEYERRRRMDRMAIRTLTRTVPGFFASRFAPVAAARSAGLTMLSIFPDLRAEFARFLMFGVRS